MKFIRIIIVGVLILSLTGCNSFTEESDKIKITVAIEPLRYFAERIVEDNIEVITMIPQNASPENYEITTKQMMDFKNSEIYFTLELPSENNSILEVTAENTKIVNLAEIVSDKYKPLKIGNDNDPHILMSISRSKIIIDEILNNVIEINKDNEELYRKNAADLISDLDNLDIEIVESLNGVKNRSFIVYHPSLQYFANEYDLNMVAIQDEGKEASAIQIVNIIDFAKDNNIKVVFYQAEIDSSQAESIAEEIDGKTVMVNPLAYDYIDNYKKMSKLIKDNMK
jgi:zinc transport system substrate-binding protein